MKIFIITLTLLLNSFLFGQNYTTEQLDSIFIEYLQIKAPHLLTNTDIDKLNDKPVIKCGLGTVNFVRMNEHLFTEQQQIIISKITSMPVGQKSIVSPNGFFRIHYDTVGVNRPGYFNTLTIEQNVDSIAAALDSSYNFEVSYLGYPPPPPDDTIGGDNLYDVFISALSSGLYGYTDPETEVSPGSNKWTSFIVIDNDYAGGFATEGIHAARVTIAHEFHHSIQMGNYLLSDSDLFFHEISSTAMEEFVFDSVNDYYAYMNSYFNYPGVSFSNNNGYNLAIWNIFLKDRFGFEILKRQWELMTQMRALNAIANSLVEYNSSFRTEFNKFGIWTFFTKGRAISGMYFEESLSYPLISTGVPISFTPPQDTINGTSLPVANNFLSLVNHTQSPADTLVVLISNSDLIKGINNTSSTTAYTYSLHTDSVNQSIKLAPGYYAYFNPGNPVNWAVSEFLNRNLVREDTTIIFLPREVVDFVFPNPFVYGKPGHENVYLTVEDAVGSELSLNIYTSAMELVYESQKTVMLYSDYKVLQWNGRTGKGERASSGVYIYAIKSGSEIRKGKLVIFND